MGFSHRLAHQRSESISLLLLMLHLSTEIEIILLPHVCMRYLRSFKQWIRLLHWYKTSFLVFSLDAFDAHFYVVILPLAINYYGLANVRHCFMQTVRSSEALRNYSQTSTITAGVRYIASVGICKLSRQNCHSGHQKDDIVGLVEHVHKL